ncbi:hypothetical protein MJA45_10135 [Paenibacillus aurantius]|uniref:Uncharacterized protein n=1 Tax=Paenibacillus aurantius TaxID=2918900 RepID=A0AA96LHE9_9BACL|nr:hypothetical protein [Paenibacillus aurantius]WJH32946.1 hypothetical protein N6H14_22260 [Paenibacillus sp. CC-CFT747]WNQ13358.1 hypothetical protein MJA45_10135 [Paenibacillus aurantius]
MERKPISSFVSSSKPSALSSSERLVYDCLQAENEELDKTDINQIAKAVGMSAMQVRAAMFLLLHKGLIKSEEVIEEA